MPVTTTTPSRPAPYSIPSRIGAVAGAAPGALLGAVFGAAALVRRTKPLHPVGHVGEGTLRITAPQGELGVPLLAAEASHSCTVRWSRAMGLPSPAPDFEGLAIRLHHPTADLLFASTGTGALTRFLLVPRPAGTHGPQTTLLPVATAAGSLMFRVTPAEGAFGDGATTAEEPPTRFDLAVAHSGSGWTTVGVLELTWGPDEPMRFDPVENLLPGTEQYPVVRALREPAYLMARRGAAARP
jgi:hypothetical protein